MEERIKKIKKMIKTFKLKRFETSQTNASEINEEIRRLEIELNNLIVKEIDKPHTFDHLKYEKARHINLPNTELFKNFLVYISSHEDDIIDDILNLSNSNQCRDFLIYGDPTLGKTILAEEIAYRYKSLGYTAIYKKLSKVDNVISLNIQKNTNKTLCIVDDCHLNVELINKFIREKVSSENHLYIFVSRNLKKLGGAITKRDVTYFLDLFKGNSYYLDASDDSYLYEKASGIIHKYKDYFTNKYNESFIIGDESKVIEIAHRNFLILSYILQLWEKDELKILENLSIEDLYKQTYIRYLYDSPVKDTIIRNAVLNQFEIEDINRQNDIEKNLSVFDLSFINFNPETNGFYIYHSDFAKILIKSYSISKEFAKLYETIDELNYILFEKYIKVSAPESKNLLQIFHNLVIQKESKLLVNLVNNPIIRDIIIEFYNQHGTSNEIAGFLSGVQNYVGAKTLKKLIEKLLIYNSEFINTFYLRDDFFASYVALYHCVYNTNSELLNLYKLQFNNEKIKIIIENTNLRDIGTSIKYLYSVDSSYSKEIFNLIITDTLKKKIKESNLFHIGKALNELKTIDFSKTRKCFTEIEDAFYIDKVEDEDVTFERFGTSLLELKNLDKIKAKAIYDDIENLIILRKIQSKNNKLVYISKPLNELSRINKDKTKKILDSIDVEMLLRIAIKEKFNILTNSLREFYSIKPEIAMHIANNISIKKWYLKILPCSLNQIGKGLSEVYFVNRETAINLYNFIDDSLIHGKSENCDINQIGRAFSELNKISTKKTKKCYKSMDVYFLLKKCRKANFKQISNALSDLSKVDNQSTVKIIDEFNSKDIDRLADQVQDYKFYEITKGLCEIHNVNNEFTKKILNTIGIQTLIHKLLDQNMNAHLLQKSLNELNKVSSDMADEMRQYI